MLLFPKRLGCFPNYAVVFQVSLLFPNLCCWFPSDAVVSQVTLSIPNMMLLFPKWCYFPSDAVSIQVTVVDQVKLLFHKWRCWFSSEAVIYQVLLLSHRPSSWCRWSVTLATSQASCVRMRMTKRTLRNRGTSAASSRCVLHVRDSDLPLVNSGFIKNVCKALCSMCKF